MSFDAPLADPVPTRRSVRTAATPVQAATDASGSSRAELRRRAGGVRPDVVQGQISLATPPTSGVGAPQDAMPVETPGLLAASATPVTSTAVDAEAPLTRRRARELAKPGVSVSAVVADEVTSTAGEASVPAGPSVASTVEPVAATVLAEPALVGPAHATESFELVEPELGPLPLPAPAETVAPSRVATSVMDEFEAAARLFSFTGETPVQSASAAEELEIAAEEQSAASPGRPGAAKGAHRAPRARRGRRVVKRVAAASFSVAVMGVVGLLAVGMTLPSQAVAAAVDSGAATNAAATQLAGDVDASAKGEIQAYVAPAEAAPATTDLDRSANYTTATLTEMAGTTGISNLSGSFFANNPACPIQWPFAVGVPISYGFGWRPGEFHEGVDFTPGAGAHIQAIADGTVRLATEAGGGYGVEIIIDHIIDGKLVSSRYAHMQHGSLQVHTGEKVSVGQYIGRTGNTGFSFGAHTHLEILINGTTPIDPLPWLRAHNQC